MPQNGFHGLVGLKLARRLAPTLSPAARQPFALGLVMGAMLPDADLYPACLLYICGRPDLLHVIHRGPTHSLLAIGVVAALGWRRGSPLLRGAALGMLTHSFLDIFFWFSPVDLFWPLSHWPAGHPLLPVVNLWKDVHLPPVFGRPDLLGNLLTGMELGACAWYLRALGGSEAPPEVARWEDYAWAAFAIASAGAVTLSHGAEDLLVMIPLLLVFLPYCWVVTYQHRDQLLGYTKEEPV